MYRQFFLVVSVILFGSSSLLAFPKRTSTMLPPFEGASAEMYEVIASITAYQDHEDENQYYYVPPFRVLPREFGTVGLAIDEFSVDESMAELGEARQLITQIQKGTHRNLERIEDQINRIEDSILSARLEGNEVLASRLEIILKNKIEDYEIEKLEILNGVAMHINLAGGKFSIDDSLSSGQLIQALGTEITKTKNSYGGFANFTIYAGLSEEQGARISEYLSHMPHIKLSVLSGYGLEFFALTELANNDEYFADTKLFRSVRGAGSLDGANIVLDLTVAGANALLANMDAFHVPLGIRANFERIVPPFKAELSCDFSVGFEVKGRADIKDGLIFFDNDLDNNIKPRNINDGACNLRKHYGDDNSIHWKMLQTLDKFYEDMKLKQVALSEEESKEYYKDVLDRINREHDRDKKNEPKGWMKVVTKIAGIFTNVYEVLSFRPEFFWHTTKQDFKRLRETKFTKTIESQGHEVFTMEWPARLCVFYSSPLKSYYPCDEIKMSEAKSLVKAAKATLRSEQCSEDMSFVECGRNRE